MRKLRAFGFGVLLAVSMPALALIWGAMRSHDHSSSSQGGVLPASSIPDKGLLCSRGDAQSTPADTLENTIAACTCTVTGGTILANGALRVTYATSGITANTNTKTVRIKYGGTNILTHTLSGATVTTNFGQVVMWNRNATNSQIGEAFGLTTAAAIAHSRATAAIDSTASQSVTLTVQKAVGTDALTVDACSVELLPKS